MNFEGFVNRVLDQIKEYLPESFQDAEFVVRQHEKLNNQYAALTIDNSKFAPVINLEDYFYDYEHGRSFHSIMGAISESIAMEQPELNFGALADFDKAKELLFIRVSSAEKNADYLKNVPHTVVEDKGCLHKGHLPPAYLCRLQVQVSPVWLLPESIPYRIHLHNDNIFHILPIPLPHKGPDLHPDLLA